MGDASYSRLEAIEVFGRDYCSGFWQLGQLPSLKRLSLRLVREERREIAVVEDSFFPSLEELLLEDFEALEGLSLGTSRCSFPRLRMLSIWSSISLKYIKLWNLAALREVTIDWCELEHAELQHLTIKHCSSLRRLTIKHCSSLRRLTVEDCCMLERAELQHLTALIHIRTCKRLTLPLLTQAYQDLRIICHRVGDPLGHLCHLVKVTLSGCLNCRCLPPPLGHLPNLKELHISKMPEVTHVGSEFHGGGGGIPFRSLQTLELRDMPRWEEWQDVEEEEGAFPNLQLLRICNCPILRSPKLSPRLLLKLESDFSCSDFAEESSNPAHYRDHKRKRIQ